MSKLSMDTATAGTDKYVELGHDIVGTLQEETSVAQVHAHETILDVHYEYVSLSDFFV